MPRNVVPFVDGLSRRKFINGKVYGVGEDAIIDLTPPDVARAWRAVSITANYVITPSVRVVFADATNNVIYIALPSAIGETLPITIRKVDSSTHTVSFSAPSGQTVDGLGSIVMDTAYSHTVVSDGQNWRTFAKEGASGSGSGGPWGDYVKRDGSTTMLADWPVGYRHFSQVGVIEVSATAPTPPVNGQGWLDTS